MSHLTICLVAYALADIDVPVTPKE